MKNDARGKFSSPVQFYFAVIIPHNFKVFKVFTAIAWNIINRWLNAYI